MTKLVPAGARGEVNIPWRSARAPTAMAGAPMLSLVRGALFYLRFVPLGLLNNEGQ